jgi:hypothetical protein
MDLYFAACQGLGLALAAGAFSGASAQRGPVGVLLLIAAMIGGGALFGWSLDQEDHPAWPGFLAGAAAAAFAFAVVRSFAEGVQARAQEDGYTGAMIALAALVLAGISLLLPPVSMLAFAGLVWLYFARRQQAARKYEGLRTLR